MLFGENGIIKKAQDAADATKNAQNTTAQGLKNLEEQIGIALGEAPTTTQGAMVDSSTKYAKYTDSTSEDFVPIPGGFGVVTGENNTIAKGLVISDLANDTLDNNEIGGKRGNQFVWVPVPDITTMYDEANNAGQLYDFSTTGMTKRSYPSTKNSGYREPDILISTTSGDASTGTANASYNGIKNLKEVIGITADEGAADANQNILDKWKTQLQKEFDDMISSVKQYKGFYIGRYETGNLSSGNKDNVPVVQKGNSQINNANWYYMYQESKNIAKENNNVTSSMIWGCQFDRTLQWLVESGDKTYAQLKDSSSWGNHSNYSSTTGDTSTASGGDAPQPTGTNPAWQANHIYDLAGNVTDLTLEAVNTNGRVSRRRQLLQFQFQQSGFLPQQLQSVRQLQLHSVLVPYFM